MTQDINLGGTIYISSKRATEITGYSQDYIGQLARAGKIDAQRVAGLWYVLEESLMRHKHKADEFVPTPPIRVAAAESEASVSFDGRDYISASRAAKITGYSQDYVGQLARGEKIPSRQIGSRWYVDRTAIIEHKRHNDSLLGAVQAESVGILRPEHQESREIDSGGIDSHEQHFNYIAEPLSPLPQYEANLIAVEVEEPGIQNQIEEDSAALVVSEFQIPIRVVEPKQTEIESDEISQPSQSVSRKQGTRIAMYSLAFLGVIVVGAAAFMQRTEIVSLSTSTSLASVNSTAIDILSPVVAATEQTAIGISNLSSGFLSKELVYQRQNR